MVFVMVFMRLYATYFFGFLQEVVSTVAGVVFFLRKKNRRASHAIAFGKLRDRQNQKM
jgi:hypothetical protein